MLAGPVDHRGTGRRGDVLADLLDLAGAHEEIRRLKVAGRAAGPDGRVLHEQHGRLLGQRGAPVGTGRIDAGGREEFLRDRGLGVLGFEGGGALRGPAERGPVGQLAGAGELAGLARGTKAHGAAGGAEELGRGEEQQRVLVAHAGGHVLVAGLHFQPVRPGAGDDEFRRPLAAGPRQRPGAARVEAFPGLQLERVAVNPHELDGGVVGLEEVAAGDDDVGRAARLERALRRADAEQAGRRGGERRERGVGAEAAAHGLADACPELGLGFLELRGRQDDRHAGLGEARGVGRRELPVLQFVELDVDGPLGQLDLGHLRKIQRQDDRDLRLRQDVADTVFGAAAAQGDVELELGGQPQHARHIQFVADLEQHGLRARHDRAERGERLVGLRALAAGGIGGVGGLRSRIPLGVEQRLADERHRAHQGGRVGAVDKIAELERQLLRGGRADNPGVETRGARADEGAGAAENAARRGDVDGGETERAKLLDALRIRRQRTGGGPLGRDPAVPGIGAGARGGGCRCRGRGIIGARGGGLPGLGQEKGRAALDEAGVERAARHIPHAGVGRRREPGADRRNDAVADDKRAVLDDLARSDHDAAADEGMDPGAGVTQTLHGRGDGSRSRRGGTIQK